MAMAESSLADVYLLVGSLGSIGLAHFPFFGICMIMIDAHVHLEGRLVFVLAWVAVVQHDLVTQQSPLITNAAQLSGYSSTYSHQDFDCDIMRQGSPDVQVLRNSFSPIRQNIDKVLPERGFRSRIRIDELAVVNC